MYSLKVERRSKDVKAKKLKREGLIPSSIFGGDLKESLLIQIPESEARKLLKVKGRGGNLDIECEGKKYNVIIEHISQNQMTHQIEDIEFQQLDENKAVSSFAQIILKNKNKIPTMVQQFITEIPYKALPSNLVETVEVDMAKLRAGSNLKVSDLLIWNKSDIEITIDGDRPVLNVAGDSRKQPQPQH